MLYILCRCVIVFLKDPIYLHNQIIKDFYKCIHVCSDQITFGNRLIIGECNFDYEVFLKAQENTSKHLV